MLLEPYPIRSPEPLRKLGVALVDGVQDRLVPAARRGGRRCSAEQLLPDGRWIELRWHRRETGRISEAQDIDGMGQSVGLAGAPAHGKLQAWPRIAAG